MNTDNTQEDKSKAGRPTLYKIEYNEQVYKLCLLGADDKAIADFFEVDVSTINNWKISHPEFFESIRAGKQIADMEVATSMYNNSIDRIITKKVPIKKKKVFWKDGKRHEEEEIEFAEQEEYLRADYRNQSLWLRNRKPKEWTDKTETKIDAEVKQTTTIINLGNGEIEQPDED